MLRWGSISRPGAGSRARLRIVPVCLSDSRSPAPRTLDRRDVAYIAWHPATPSRFFVTLDPAEALAFTDLASPLRLSHELNAGELMGDVDLEHGDRHWMPVNRL